MLFKVLNNLQPNKQKMMDSNKSIVILDLNKTLRS